MADDAHDNAQGGEVPLVAAPYVGPRPFEREDRDRFFGRRREGRRLRNRVLSNSVVLFHAQSGCGKTSLLNAYLLPMMEEEGFRVLPVARVKQALPPGLHIDELDNIYVFNTVRSWDEPSGIEADPKRTLIRAFRDQLPPEVDEEEPPSCLIVLDQFEEVFTSYPSCWSQRGDFFGQLDEILTAYPSTRIVFSIREDYLAHLDPYLTSLAKANWSRLRLEPLGQEEAIEAITKPLHRTERFFAPGVAERLVKDLAAVQARDESGETKTIPGQFVEPVQLQVACQSLWESMDPEVNEIDEHHLTKFGDVDQALRSFYESAISRSAEDPNMQKLLRGWVETRLITSADTRGMVMEGASESAEIPDEVLTNLLDAHLIRGEWRHGARWFELTHDRFIRPIQESNQAFWEQLQEKRADEAEAKAKRSELHAENTRRLSEVSDFLLGSVFLCSLLVAFSFSGWIPEWVPNWIALVPLVPLAMMAGFAITGACFYAIRWTPFASIQRNLVHYSVATLLTLGCAFSLFVSRPWFLIALGVGVLWSLVGSQALEDVPLDVADESLGGEPESPGQLEAAEAPSAGDGPTGSEVS